jgi:hypothetical protein
VSASCWLAACALGFIPVGASSWGWGGGAGGRGNKSRAFAGEFKAAAKAGGFKPVLLSNSYTAQLHHKVIEAQVIQRSRPR